MAFVIICPGCATRLTLGDDRAGTTLACPNCESFIQVPTVQAKQRPLVSATSLPPVKKQSRTPIEFLCPACRARLRISQRKAATEIRCPKCNRRVIVPTPPDRPLEGILIDSDSAPVSTPPQRDPVPAGRNHETLPDPTAPEPFDLDECHSEQHAEKPAATPAEPPPLPASNPVEESLDDEEENYVPIRRRRRQSRWRTPLLTLVAACCSAFFLGGTLQWLIAKNAERQCEEYTRAGRKVTPQTYTEIEHQKDRALVLLALGGVACVGAGFVAVAGRSKSRFAS